jgi:hypothetical protein
MPESEPSPADAAAEALGLPWVQDFVARYVAFPAYCRTTSFDRVTRDFQAEIGRIEDLCGRFSPEDFGRRVTVPPMVGLEDDERHWSAALVVEHSVLVGETIGRTLIFLSRNQSPPDAFRREDLKPRGGKGVAVMEDLRRLSRDYPHLVRTELGSTTGTTLHRHPFFGDLDVHRWHCLSVSHLRVHRRQLHEIRRRITAEAKRGGMLSSLLFDPAAGMDPQP